MINTTKTSVPAEYSCCLRKLAVAAGKEGTMYVLNQDALGGFSATNSGAVGEVGIGGCFCGQSYFSSGSQVTVKTRNGKLVKVDASVAIQHEQCIGLEVGEPVDVQGAIDANGVLQANTIQRAKDSDKLWTKDN